MTLPAPPLDLLEGSSLFLDFDGTLVELAATPDAVVVTKDLRNLLERLSSALGGRVVLISGRAAADVRALIAPLEMTIAGSHGLEREQSLGQLPPSGVALATRTLHALAARHEGLLVEEKPFGVALHYRLAPETESACRDLAERTAQAHGLIVQPGKMVVELKPASGDKGVALSQFMMEEPFAGTRPVFIGDDFTDEHAFAAARQMGGAAVLVGSERDTVATTRLPDVAAVHRWLDRACEALA